MKKKLLDILISLSMLSPAVPAAFAAQAEAGNAKAVSTETPASEPADSAVSLASVTESGTCGDGLTWTLDGTGTMTDYTYGSSPFYSNGSITSLVIEDGVTSVGDYAFYSCYALVSVTLPESLTSIASSRFLTAIP